MEDETATETSEKEGIRNPSAENGGNSITEQAETENEGSFQSSLVVCDGWQRGSGEEVDGEGDRAILAEDARSTGCFGVRSYLHQFYDAEKTPHIYEDFVEEDDFEYLVDPGKRRARWCCWFRWCTWSGANLLLIGVITLLVGYLTPKRDVIVGYHDHLEILDRWAITFNQRLELCRVAGLVLFCLGAVVVLVALLISACANNNDRLRYERSFTYITTAAVVGGGEMTYKQGGGCCKIPITEEIKPIQPEGDAGSDGKDRAIVVQMPYY